ncbi:hypothetical protein SAMN05421837_110169 [Amycolatopsis pretoriensis]|uniref:Outer membrane lipoprotein-sorting protein n=1 Tax=Amycolatopsis pretoriensis TaxID=218821 RepID=A0A1H5REE5_9PSEU|nr:hypothetical protein [Amycolatopsis pretoriensis]SEF36414.1 hypothetical protein SAMN05421837_110169 [Amycolatopsis pretoriensis]
MTPSVVRHAKRRRWAVVAAVAAVLVSVPSVVAALAPAGASTDPARLRELVLASAGKPYQGYAESAGSLALPELPNLAPVTALFSMRTPMRAWYAGPDRYRVDILGTAGEHDVYRLPDGEYTWDYGDNTLTALVGEPSVRLPRAADLLPPELARRILEAAKGDPVSALPGRNVAGVAASGFRLVPADPATTIGRVDVWADPATGVAVRVEVTARGQQAPILVTEFQQLEQTTPVVEAPRPVPGSGYTVASAPDVSNALGALAQAPLPPTLAGRPVSSSKFGGVEGAALYGTGLAAFAVIAVPRAVGNAASDAAGKAGAVQTKLAAGTVVQLSITPLSLAIVRASSFRRSYLLAGTVTPDVLRTVAEELTNLRRGFR